MFHKVAIVGAGNLGRYLGAKLALAGVDVFYCVRRPMETVKVAGVGTLTPRWYTSDPPPADLVLLTVKSYDTASAMPWLDVLCTDGQPVAVVQNGIHHEERIRPYRAIPVLSYVYVEEREGAHHAFAPPRAALSTEDSAEARNLAALFDGTGVEVRNEANFLAASWRKMLHNCVSNPLTAIARRGLEILTERAYSDWSQEIIAEGLAVAKRDGAGLTGTDGEEILAVLRSYPDGTRTSMLQDAERGKRLELDALNGKLVELADGYGIAVPANRRVLERLGYSS